MPDIHVNMDEARDAKPDELTNIPQRKVEVVGNPKPASFEDALGLDEAKGRQVEPPMHKATQEVLGGKSETVDTGALRKQIALEEENKFLKSERGKVGREVVGPLRQENQDLKDRLSAIETKLASGTAQQAAPVDAAQYARQLFGTNVDVEDPEVMRQTAVALSILDAAERGTQSYVKALDSKLDAIREELSGTRHLAASGLSDTQVQQAQEAHPELMDLPESSRYALMRRLFNAGKQQTPQQGGRQLASDAHADQRPENFVEGGSGFVSDQMGADDADLWSQRMERFKALGRDRKSGGARAQTSVFVDMLRSGKFSQ